MKELKVKRFLLYLIKWQCGTPVILLCMAGIPLSSGTLKTIIANVIGGIIFYPIDLALFNKRTEGK